MICLSKIKAMTKEVEFALQEIIKHFQKAILDYQNQEISVNELVLTLNNLIQSYNEKYGVEQGLPRISY
jgi:hypothetical protein